MRTIKECIEKKEWKSLNIYNLKDWTKSDIKLLGSVLSEAIECGERFSYSLYQNPLFLEEVLNRKAYSLLEEFTYDTAWTKDNIELLGKVLPILTTNQINLPFSLKMEPLFLREVINSKQYQLLKNFVLEKVWTDENINLIKNVLTEVVKSNIEFPGALISNPEILKEVITKKEYKVLNKFIIKNAWTKENINLLGKHLPEIAINNIELPNAAYQSELLLQEILNSKQYPLIEKLGYNVWSDENIKILGEKLPEIVQSNIKLPSRLFKSPIFLEATINKEQYKLLKEFVFHEVWTDKLIALLKPVIIDIVKNNERIPYFLYKNSELKSEIMNSNDQTIISKFEERV